MLQKLLFMFFSLVLFASCSSTDEVMEHNENVAVNAAEIENVYNRIDSINNIYMVKAQETRGIIDWGVDIAVRKAADNVGRVAGSYAGKYLGGAIGSISANPLGTISGYLIGDYVDIII